MGEDRFSKLRDYVPVMHEVSGRTGVPLEFLLILAWAEFKPGDEPRMLIPLRSEDLVPLGFKGPDEELLSPTQNIFWAAQFLRSKGVSGITPLPDFLNAYKGAYSTQYWGAVQDCIRYLRYY